MNESSASLGLRRGTVELRAHDAAWETSAEETIALLRSELGEDAADAQHVGSTAIPAVRAKPIVDVALAVRDFADVRRHDAALAEKGVIFRGEDQPGQLLYVRGDFAADTRTHHIHVVLTGSEAWENYLNFRDYLNAEPGAAKRYDEKKGELAARFPLDRSAYTEGKAALVAQLLEEARSWRAGR